MLFWHKHNIEKSLADLPNFTPFPDEWTVEDKVLFEQGFSFHGKTFHRIQQMVSKMAETTLTIQIKHVLERISSFTNQSDNQNMRRLRDPDYKWNQVLNSNAQAQLQLNQCQLWSWIMMCQYGMSDVSNADVFDLQTFLFVFCTSFQTSQLQAWLDSITHGRKRAAKRVWWTAMHANRREIERRGQREDINRMFAVSFCVCFLRVLIKDCAAMES